MFESVYFVDGCLNAPSILSSNDSGNISSLKIGFLEELVGGCRGYFDREILTDDGVELSVVW